jgi:hypothetical protein
MFQVWLVEQNCPLDCRDDSVDVLPGRLSAHAQPAMVESSVAGPDPGASAFLAPALDPGWKKSISRFQDPG